jgi:hypothetical protein
MKANKNYYVYRIFVLRYTENTREDDFGIVGKPLDGICTHCDRCRVAVQLTLIYVKHDTLSGVT